MTMDCAALADGLPPYACQLPEAGAKLTIAGTDPYAGAEKAYGQENRVQKNESPPFSCDLLKNRIA